MSECENADDAQQSLVSVKLTRTEVPGDRDC